MLNCVLFLLCVVAAGAAILTMDQAIKLVPEHPAVRKVLLNDMVCYAIMTSLMLVLWFASAYVDGILPGFNLVLFGNFIIISVAVAGHSWRYARQHVPA